MNILKNRTLLGMLCIVLSLVICFAITPLVNKGLSQKTTIVRFKTSLEEGEQITKDMVETVEVGAYNLPHNVVKDVSDTTGKFVTARVFKGDYVLTDKLSDTPASENRYLYNLDGTRQAVSITLNTFAEGLSGKLRSGDIVSVIAPDYLKSGETMIPPELTYVEVIAATSKSGFDAELTEEKDVERELPSTVTVLVTPLQSKLLARLEAEGDMHLSLVYRGDSNTAAQFLAVQEEVLEKLAIKEQEAEKETETGAGQKEAMG